VFYFIFALIFLAYLLTEHSERSIVAARMDGAFLWIMLLVKRPLFVTRHLIGLTGQCVFDLFFQRHLKTFRVACINN